jgi:hypothetical protein
LRSQHVTSSLRKEKFGVRKTTLAFSMDRDED